MSYLVSPRQSFWKITTNAEESSEVEVAVLEQSMAKDRITLIKNVCSDVLLTSGNGQNVNASVHIELSTHLLEAEMKKDGR